MRELIRVNTLVEANDLKMFLNSRGIECEIPDQYSLGIRTVSNFALAQGRILVSEDDYDDALELLKTWQSPNVPGGAPGLSRTLEYPWVVGISPRQITQGFKNWGQLSFLSAMKVLGGVAFYFGIVIFAMALIYSYIHR